MMRQMREATKPIMIASAVAFIALMVFQWGMDITGRSSGGLGEIGRVNGDAVLYDAYMATYRQLYEQVQSQQEELIGSQQNKEIEDQAFENVVTQLLINQELRRRGIGVTDQEISEAAQFSPPDYLRPQFADANGGLDLTAYQSFLATLPPEQLVILEAYYRDVIPRTKLLRQISTGIYVPDTELWRQWRDENETAEIRYVPLNPATRYPDSDFPVGDSEVQAYYRAHQDEFAVPARANVRYVVIDKTPTAADTAASRQRADSLRQLVSAGQDFAEIARTESADQATAANGGEMGVIRKGQMIAAFDSAAFSGATGILPRSVQTGFGFHIIDVMERWGADSARVRHILIPVARTDSSEVALFERADELEDLAEGMPLQEAAAQMGLEARTADITQDFPFLAGVGQISEGSDWVFEEASVGDVSPVFETTTAFYALEVVESSPAGVLEIGQARAAIEETLRFDQKLERAREQAQQVADRARSGTPLLNVAAEMGLEGRTAGPFSRNDFVPGIGRQNAVIGAAFGLPIGQVSDAIATENNQYVIEVLARTPADSTAWNAQLPQQRAQAVAALQQQRLTEWIDALRASARVVDRRAEVLVPLDEDAPQQQFPFF
ncbi:MAG: peptidylprolyl isomerase [Gemmatimonadales bacterium]